MATSQLTELGLADGPVVNVGTYDEQVTLKFDWSVNQRWYLSPAEAREIAQAMLRAADDTDAYIAKYAQ